MEFSLDTKLLKGTRTLHTCKVRELIRRETFVRGRGARQNFEDLP